MRNCRVEVGSRWAFVVQCDDRWARQQAVAAATGGESVDWSSKCNASDYEDCRWASDRIASRQLWSNACELYSWLIKHTIMLNIFFLVFEKTLEHSRSFCVEFFLNLCLHAGLLDFYSYMGSFRCQSRWKTPVIESYAPLHLSYASWFSALLCYLPISFCFALFVRDSSTIVDWKVWNWPTNRSIGPCAKRIIEGDKWKWLVKSINEKRFWN
jgi:hypothetical protein